MDPEMTRKIHVGMTRKIPSESNSLLFFLKIGDNQKVENYLDEYEKAMISKEISMEEWLLNTFSHLGIHATVKSDRYSLPIMYQIKSTQYGETYLNGAFETFNIFKKVLGKLLAGGEAVYKIRFYVFAEIEDHFPMGKVNYYFNYYVHETTY